MKYLTVKSRLWVVGKEGTFLGEGRVALLHAINRLGSISKAAKSMNMSYLKAWKLVKSMNQTSPKPLVKKSSGGKDGGGTTLTEYGHKAIKLFEELSDKHNQYLSQKFENQLKELQNGDI